MKTLGRSIGGLILAFALLFTPTALQADPKRPGPFSYEHLQFPDLTDKARNRVIATRLTLPKGEGPFPLVVMCHGLGGNVHSHDAIVEHLASHGYVVLTPEHPTSNFSFASQTVASHKQERYGERIRLAMREIALHPRAALGRAKDVSFLIDQAQRWNQGSDARLSGRFDLAHIGVAGHSFGAYTVLTSCGARPSLQHLRPQVGAGEGLADSLRDPRISAGVAYSPQGPGNGLFSKGSYSELNVPLLMMSGSRDKHADFVNSGSLPAKNRYRAFELAPSGHKYYAWLWNAGHMGWADFRSNNRWLQAGARKTVPENADVLRISKVMTVVFFDHYLKGAPRDNLSRAYVKSLTGKVVRRVNWTEK